MKARGGCGALPSVLCEGVPSLSVPKAPEKVMGVTRFAMGCACLCTPVAPPVADAVTDAVADILLGTLKNVIFAMKRLKVSSTPKNLDPAQCLMTL